jgi:hypothetical protein
MFHDALDRAAREHAAAEPPHEDDGASAGAEDAASDTGYPLNAALHHENAALLNLHGQAIAMQKFGLLCPYSSTSPRPSTPGGESFLLTLAKFSLEHHVLPDAAAPISPDWVRMDCVVLTWLTSTITTISPTRSPSVVPLLGSCGSPSSPSFLGIVRRVLFTQTRSSCSFTQGDLPVAEYCRRYKRMAEDL